MGLIALIIIMGFFIFFCLADKPDDKKSNTASPKPTPQVKTQPVCDCQLDIDFHGLEYELECKYYTWDKLYKAKLDHNCYFIFAHFTASDKSVLQQAIQIIIDKWTEAQKRRIEFFIIDLTKWNADEISLTDFVLKHIMSDEEDDEEEDDDNFDIFGDNDDFGDDDLDLGDDLDFGDDLDEEDYDDEDDLSDDEANKQAKKKAKQIDLKSAQHGRSILRHMADQLDEIESSVGDICDSMESHHGNISYYPSIREMHENLENLRARFSQIANDMRDV